MRTSFPSVKEAIFVFHCVQLNPPPPLPSELSYSNLPLTIAAVGFRHSINNLSMRFYSPGKAWRLFLETRVSEPLYFWRLLLRPLKNITAPATGKMKDTLQKGGVPLRALKGWGGGGGGSRSQFSRDWGSFWHITLFLPIFFEYAIAEMLRPRFDLHLTSKIKNAF